MVAEVVFGELPGGTESEASSLGGGLLLVPAGVALGSVGSGMAFFSRRSLAMRSMMDLLVAPGNVGEFYFIFIFGVWENEEGGSLPGKSAARRTTEMSLLAGIMSWRRSWFG